MELREIKFRGKRIDNGEHQTCTYPKCKCEMPCLDRPVILPFDHNRNKEHQKKAEERTIEYYLQCIDELKKLITGQIEMIEDRDKSLMKKDQQIAKLREALEGIEKIIDNQDPNQESIWRIAYNALKNQIQ